MTPSPAEIDRILSEPAPRHPDTVSPEPGDIDNLLTEPTPDAEPTDEAVWRAMR